MLRALIFALLLVSPVVSAPLSQHQPAKTSQQNTTQEQRGTEAAPLFVKVVSPAQTEADLAREDAKDKEKVAVDTRLINLTGDLARYTMFLFIATALLALVTAGLVIVGFLQVRDAKESIAATKIAAFAAKKQADAAVGIELPIFIIGGPRFQKGSDTCQFLSQNQGRTGATIINTCITFAALPYLPPKPRYPLAYIVQRDEYIDAGKPFKLAVNNIVDEANWDAALDGKTIIWVYGFFEYRDFLKEIHVERFCFGSRPGPVTQHRTLAGILSATSIAPEPRRTIVWVSEGPTAYTYSGYKREEPETE